MKTVVLSSSPLILKDNRYFAYSPYVHELEIWANYSDSISFVCPIWKEDKGLLVTEIKFPIASVVVLDEFNLKSIQGILNGFLYFIPTLFKFFKAIRKAEHVHLRCPGTSVLLACFVQILFPKKYKTAKYAGNWDSNSKQPLSYRIQKWLLNHPFFTKNCQVLVYGSWPSSSKNVKPFFTATYAVNEMEPIVDLSLQSVIDFVFVGTLVAGKRPLYAIQLVEHLKKQGQNVRLTLYGNGSERTSLQAYCNQNGLNDFVIFKGNQPRSVVKMAFQHSHFVILASSSEGWPKALAEGMFWGSVPIATPISCVPYILNKGERGQLLQMNLNEDVEQINQLLHNVTLYTSKRTAAVSWSRQYTLDYFESEIKLLLKA